MLIIFYDEIEKHKNTLDKISEENKFLVKNINVFDYLNNCEKFTINSSDVVYFLLNTNVKTLLVSKLNSLQCTILNKKFFLKNLDKEKVQRILLNNQINVPKIIELNKITDTKVIVKSKNHTLPVNIFENKKELNKFLANKNICDFYVEELIDKDNEYKIYFVKGKVFFYDNVQQIYDENLYKTLQLISEILKLDIYSTDVLFKDNKFYIVDINSVTGLFMSKNARKELINLAK